MKRFLILLVACGGGHAQDACDRWVARARAGAADRQVCEQVLDGGVAELAAPASGPDRALVLAQVGCMAEDYERCAATAASQLASVRGAIDAPAAIRAHLDERGPAAEDACGVVRDAVGLGFGELGGLADRPQIRAIEEADGALCHRDLFIHRSRVLTCIEAGSALANIEAPYRSDQETQEAWADLLARCPDQKGILTEVEHAPP